jgi:release factor glutamine methyltransferase
MLYNTHHSQTSLDEHYPIEYKDGLVVFFGKTFTVTPDVLIPRLETEGLVRRVRSILRTRHIYTLIDIGTWSGIIPTSCADLVQKILCVDLSPQALQVAEKNFCSYFYDKEVNFVQSDLLASLSLDTFHWDLCITANLPYIRAEDWEHMSLDTRYEPRMALFGWEMTGFELYEVFFEQLANWWYPYARYVVIEFGFDQQNIADDILKKYPWQVIFFPDYAGIERFAEIYIPPTQ